MDVVKPKLGPSPDIIAPLIASSEPQNDVTYFAETNYHNIRRKFGIKRDDRRRHMYLIGKTGMGKSTALENMIMADVIAGNGLVVIDPLGDLVEKVIDYIPASRINDVIYFNPADFDYPVAFNVLESVDPNHRHLVSSGLIAVFKKIWVDSWGPRLEYVLRNCILSLLEYPGSTLLGVTRLLVDNKYRKKIVDKITDPIVKAFWVDEFNAYSNQFRTEAVSPIQNKVGQFLSSSVIRNIVGQSKSSFDLRWLMDEGKILLMNLAKGRIGEDNSSLLGSMMITKIQLAAMSRVDSEEINRRDFYMYVDEFQNFATDSFATILSEARKYHLNLIIAHQYIEQLSETVQAAVFGNVGTIACFRIGAADAEFLEKEFAPVFTETDLVNLTKYDIYLKLMIDGVASDPFSATGLPPLELEYPREENREKIIRVSRERYATPRLVVEEKIIRWSGVGNIFKGSAEGENESAASHERFGERKEQRPDREPAKAPVDITSNDLVEEPSVIETPAPISLAEALQRAPVTFSKNQKPPQQRKSGGATLAQMPSRTVPPPTANRQQPRDIDQLPPQTHHLQPGKVIHP